MNHIPGGVGYVIDMELLGTRQKSTRSSRQTHFFDEIDKYEPWQKRRISSPTVTNLNYARLIPTKRETTEVKIARPLRSVFRRQLVLFIYRQR